jgi:hypothetical protein
VGFHRNPRQVQAGEEVITQEIKLYKEPEPAAPVNVTYFYGNKKWTVEELEEAVQWAQLCGLHIGQEIRDTQNTTKKMVVTGYKVNPETIGSYKGNPAIILCSTTTNFNSYESAFTTEELLDKRYEYVLSGV